MYISTMIRNKKRFTINFDKRENRKNMTFVKIVLQNVSADTNFGPTKLSFCKNSASLQSTRCIRKSLKLKSRRLDLAGTKFASADTFCRTIFTLKIFVLVLCSKIHNAIKHKISRIFGICNILCCTFIP
ncbi:hypothetical protein BpHYR1_036245 [Brachionus plicatilis]|uniref:Uncharacterized protein n=1 Tax=Brachionus plicatilis TaxID=10195 RepID=A0A3M7RGZ1_BRAPC|nr:hypothetical protein BpHYR1_036245 [Brachionus plicatilis]